MSSRVPDLTVVIPCFNEAERIGAALRSVFNQRGAETFEVIVVDSSSDETAAIVRRDFPSVRLLTHASRLSAGAARNLGLREARGRKVLVTDADIRVPPDWIRRMSAHLDEVDVVGGSIANGTPRSLTGTLLHLLEFFRLLPDHSASCHGDARFVATANAGYRRAALGDRQFVDASAAEDVIFHQTLVAAGLRCRFDPGLAVMHENKRGWRTVARHLRALGVGGYRWRASSAPTQRFSLRHPYIMVLKPFAVVGALLVGRLRARQWRLAAEVIVLSPLLLALDAFWVAGFLRASRGVE